MEQQRESTKSVNWQDFLRSHPIFSSLNEEEIANLLRDEVSQERAYPQGSVILKAVTTATQCFSSAQDQFRSRWEAKGEFFRWPSYRPVNSSGR